MIHGIGEIMGIFLILMLRGLSLLFWILIMKPRHGRDISSMSLPLS
jgi:hypothetical protein